jgi:hypothetical protein
MSHSAGARGPSVVACPIGSAAGGVRVGFGSPVAGARGLRRHTPRELGPAVCGGEHARRLLAA